MNVRRSCATALVAWLVWCGPGCASSDRREADSANAPPPEVTADFFSCSKSSDCVLENQRDCCPCNAGGRQVAVRKKALDAYRAARAAHCTGELLCPQVYLCDDSATALCLAGKCALGHGGAPSPAR